MLLNSLLYLVFSVQAPQGNTFAYPSLIPHRGPRGSVVSATSVCSAVVNNRLKYKARNELTTKQTPEHVGLVARRQTLFHKSNGIGKTERHYLVRQIPSAAEPSSPSAGSYDNSLTTCSPESASSVMSPSINKMSWRSMKNALFAKYFGTRCPICDVKLPSKCMVRRHINKMHITSIRSAMLSAGKLSKLSARFNSPFCGLTLASAESLQQHKDRVHEHGDEDLAQGTKAHQHSDEGHVLVAKAQTRRAETSRPSGYMCEKCGKSFAARSSFSRHRILAHNPPSAKPVCGDCGREFSHKSSLVKHIKGVHLKLRPHLCPTCGDRFLHGDNMRTHMRLVHRINMIRSS